MGCAYGERVILFIQRRFCCMKPFAALILVRDAEQFRHCIFYTVFIIPEADGYRLQEFDFVRR